uniref:Chitinase class V n=1 Tax=Nepenthes sp. MF-2019 TaxID=2518353 RepID=A0A411KAZ2_9CARY|nr:chitinase class V [Nepenthes sp. MF-2019]
MGKNQVRRPTSDSNRRRMRDKPSTQKDQTPDSPFQDFRYYDRRLIAVFVVLFVVPPSISVLIYRFKFSPKSGPILLPYVRQRGLVKADVNCEEILTEHSNVSENTSRRHFMDPVLAYITPWNSGGYDMAKRFTFKFTHMSPVWYDLKSHGTKLVLEGRHNADIGWISELRMRGDVQVLPRIVLEALPQYVLREKKQRDKAVDLILKECKDMGYDGIVLESWSRWAAHGVLHDATMRKVVFLFFSTCQFRCLNKRHVIL